VADTSPVEIAFVAAPDAETAARIARTLVEERLAACVSVLPGVTSIYRWKDAVETASETILLVKTRADRGPALEARVRELHPYELPEVVRVGVSGGSLPYLNWVRAEASP
jgi:periplasmic divalent cation tolerance protein